jgi:hypothetical protein
LVAQHDEIGVMSPILLLIILFHYLLSGNNINNVCNKKYGKGSGYMLKYKMGELKDVAVKTKSKSLDYDHKLIIVTESLKYDRIYIANLLTKKMLDSIR